jgi:tetratricopeptide (TPR) repeat protein
MKLFAQAARRRGSIQRVLQLPLPGWTENARAWLEELQKDLSPAAKEAMKRLSVLSFVRPVERELVVATGETPEIRASIEQGLDELDRAYLLQRSEDKLQLHDILGEYWLGEVLDETLKELGKAMFEEMLSAEYIDKGKINIWCNSASEWIVDNLPQRSVDPILFASIDVVFDFVIIDNDCALNRIYLLLENRRQKGEIDKNEVENIAKKLLKTIKRIYPEHIDNSPIAELYAKIVLIIADLLIQRGDIDEAQRLCYDSLDYIESVFESANFSNGYIEIIKAVCDLLKKQNREKELFDLIKSKIYKFERDKQWLSLLLAELYEILSNLCHEKGIIELAEIYIQKANELKKRWTVTEITEI